MSQRGFGVGWVWFWSGLVFCSYCLLLRLYSYSYSLLLSHTIIRTLLCSRDDTGASSISHTLSSTLFFCLLYLSFALGVSSCFAFAYWVVVYCLLLHGDRHSVAVQGFFARFVCRVGSEFFGLVYRYRQHHSFIRIPHFPCLSAFSVSCLLRSNRLPLSFCVSLCRCTGGRWVDGVLCRLLPLLFHACCYTAAHSLYRSCRSFLVWFLVLRSVIIVPWVLSFAAGALFCGMERIGVRWAGTEEEEKEAVVGE